MVYSIIGLWLQCVTSPLPGSAFISQGVAALRSASEQTQHLPKLLSLCWGSLGGGGLGGPCVADRAGLSDMGQRFMVPWWLSWSLGEPWWVGESSSGVGMAFSWEQDTPLKKNIRLRGQDTIIELRYNWVLTVWCRVKITLLLKCKIGFLAN